MPVLKNLGVLHTHFTNFFVLWEKNFEDIKYCFHAGIATVKQDEVRILFEGRTRNIMLTYYCFCVIVWIAIGQFSLIKFSISLDIK